MNFYKILNCNINDNQQTIKKNYYKLCKKYHPDKTKQNNDSQIKNINLAYEVLGNPDKRYKYDLYVNTNPLSINNYSFISNSYHLSMNYPNPFNAITRMDFSIPIDQFINIKVYDILGNKIITLINDNLSAGKHNIQWDASNYPSGVYFIKLECENYYSMRKMLFLK